MIEPTGTLYMTRVKCWWKPLSNELVCWTSTLPLSHQMGDEKSSPVPTIPVRQEAPSNAEGLGSIIPGGSGVTTNG